MRFWRTALLMCSATFLASAAESLPVDLIPPGTKVLVGVSMRSLIDSPMFKGVVGSAPLPSSLGIPAPFAGIDPLKDLDSVLIATTAAGDKAPALVIVRGRFSSVKTEGAKKYQGAALFDDPKDPKSSIAVLDSETAIAGTLADVKAAIDRRGSSTTMPADLADRYSRLAGNYDLWGFGDVPKGLSAIKGTAKGVDSIDSFEFGAALRDGLRFTGQVHLRNPKDAAELESTVGLLMMMAKAQPNNKGVDFDVKTENSTIKVNFFIPEAELKKAMTTQANTLASLLQGGGMSAAPAAFGAAPAAAVAPRPPAPVYSRPASSPGKVITNSQGDTVQVTLPGAK